MRSLLIVAAAACLLAAAIAVEAPATLADRQLDMLTHGRLRVAGATGTIWNGSGELTLLPYAARVPVVWHIDALPLLRSRLNGTLGADTPEASQTRFSLSSEDFALNRFAMALPADALLRGGAAPAVITAAGGLVDIKVDALAMREGIFDGGFVARWQDASLTGPRPEIRIALGNVRLDGKANGGEIEGVLSNTGGDIEITGTMFLGAAGSVRAEARLKPRAGIDPSRSNAITAALSMIGSADGSAGFRVAWQAPRR